MLRGTTHAAGLPLILEPHPLMPAAVTEDRATMNETLAKATAQCSIELRGTVAAAPCTQPGLTCWLRQRWQLEGRGRFRHGRQVTALVLGSCRTPGAREGGHICPMGCRNQPGRCCSKQAHAGISGSQGAFDGGCRSPKQNWLHGNPHSGGHGWPRSRLPTAGSRPTPHRAAPGGCPLWPVCPPFSLHSLHLAIFPAAAQSSRFPR